MLLTAIADTHLCRIGDKNMPYFGVLNPKCYSYLCAHINKVTRRLHNRVTHYAREELLEWLTLTWNGKDFEIHRSESQPCSRIDWVWRSVDPITCRTSLR